MQPKLVFVQSATLASTFQAVLERLSKVEIYPREIAPQALEDGAESLHNTDVIVASSNLRLDAGSLRQSERLRAVVYGAIGTDGIDLDAATALGIAVGHAPTEQNCRSMAEATVMLMLALLYDLRGTEHVARHNLSRSTAMPRAQMLSGKTIGFVGFGRIAKSVACSLSGWGVTMQAYQPNWTGPEVALGVRRLGIGELLATSDIVSVHASYRAGTPALLGEREFQLMKPSAFLINTARGGLVDEPALYRALESKRIAGAALDTFAVEPLPPQSPLRTLSNVILTPHMVGHTRELQISLEDTLFENIRRVLRGQPPQFVRNPAVLTAWRQRWTSLPLIP